MTVKWLVKDRSDKATNWGSKNVYDDLVFQIIDPKNSTQVSNLPGFKKDGEHTNTQFVSKYPAGYEQMIKKYKYYVPKPKNATKSAAKSLVDKKTTKQETK
jgi:hypothetical protein